MNVEQFKIPRHIAIIMDGNGRWAKRQGRERVWGHREGANAVDQITRECVRLGVQQLTLYTFSHENWQRPADEVRYLMTLLRRFLIKQRNVIVDNNIRFITIGEINTLPSQVLRELKITCDASKNNTGMTLCLAISYGGRNELIHMVKNIAKQVVEGKITIDEIDETLCNQNLYQPDMPELDLLIRTGGEQRISNYLLWQVSYSELWFTKTLWPDFTKEELHQALESFSKRKRRYGKVLDT
ncbi:MAG: isoprenyl transferase [Planctomycetes bacterium]|nr:isoprenyl transferase [Planctomycetota bacterium]HNZ66799.1 isoprenyl transferase [Planctomycetota bacterium]HPY74529.1 isoprenyl transferase [Planctomycetota bacterium]HQB00174.1 isoprenyl transferase [Planctomycetota bacterium]